MSMNEIYHSYEEGNTLYALIWRKSDDKVFDQSDGGDTFEVYVEANIGNYDVAMTNQGDGVGGYSTYYSVDFPAVITTEGVYRVQVMLQAAGSPHADNDIAFAQGEMYWDGITELDLFTLSLEGNKVHSIYGLGE